MVAKRGTRPARRSTLAGVYQRCSADGPAVFQAGCQVTARPMPAWAVRLLQWLLRVALGLQIEQQAAVQRLAAPPLTLVDAYRRSVN